MLPEDTASRETQQRKMTTLLIGLVVAGAAGFFYHRKTAALQEQRHHTNVRLEKNKPADVTLLADKFASGEVPTEAEIARYSAYIGTREATYSLLHEQGKVDLFPKAYYTIKKAAESNLANWLAYPNGLDAIPDEVVHLEEVVIDFNGHDVIYHVFKYRAHPPHWAAKDGWMIGVVGPYFDDSKPYNWPGGTFSRFKKVGEVSPRDEAQWVHTNISMRKA